MNLLSNAFFKLSQTNLLLKGLLFPVILLYFSACQEASDIGLELQDSDLFGSTSFTDTVTIETAVVLLDSVVTSTSTRTLVGRMIDDKFGDLVSTGYIQVILPTEDSALVFGTNQAVFDSVVLQIPSSGVFGDADATVNYQIFELTEKVDTINYLRTDSLGYEPMPIGSVAYNPADDSLNLFRVRLDDAFGQKIFAQSGQSVLQNQDEFDALVGGIRIAVDGSNEGHVMALNPRTVGTVSFVRIYYSEPGDTTSSFRTLGFGNSFHNISSDFSGTPLDGLTIGGEIPTEMLGNEAYLQMGLGLSTKITFPYLDSLKQGGNIILNRAQLIMDPVDGSIAEHGTPPASFIFLLYDEDSDTLSTTPSAVQSQGGALSTAQYNAGGRSISDITLTLYLQAVIDGTQPNSSLVLGYPEPVQDAFGRPVGTRPRLSNPVSLQKLLIGDPNHPVSRQMKLELYLTRY